MAETDPLLTRWYAALAGTTGGPPPDEAADAGRDLLRRYAEPQRRYHTTGHLRAVLDHVDALAGEARDADAVRLAAWFHDAVYDPAAPGNEERSARLAEGVLPGLGVPGAAVAECARLVRLTAGHAVAAEDRNGAVLCDADLAVLAGTPEDYAAYAAAVRAEYAAVDEEAFRAGRAAVLRDLLGHGCLFRTRAGRERLEARARANLRAELTLLDAAAPHAEGPRGSAQADTRGPSGDAGGA